MVSLILSVMSSLSKISETYFISHGSEKIADRVTPVFPMSSQTAGDRFVEPRVPVFSNNISRIGLESDQSRVLRSRVRIGYVVETCRSAMHSNPTRQD